MRRTLPIAMALVLAAAACGPAEVVVTMEIDVPNPDAPGTTMTRPLSEVEVQLLPYDRDQIFDSLEAAFPEPEPEIPEDLLAAREAVQEAQERWRQAETRWNNLRDTLQKLTDAMEGYSRGEARYVAMYREFQELDSQLSQVERNMNRAFEEFTELQKGTIARSDSMRIMIDNWADEAFADAGEIMAQKLRESGLPMVVDTTDANGVVRMRAKPGKYWVHARYELPYTELYWNVPVTLQRGDPVQVRLTRENAEERIKL
ncbi:MAG: hypothetical protein ACE5GJ_06070 [Gemmatimonadota bacterium]